jgi:nitrogen fixation protein FixH
MTELKGWHVLVVLLCFFGVTIGVNAVFVAAALNSSTGEYQKKSYLQGLRYNDVLAARARQRDMGWSAELNATRLEEGRYGIAIKILDRDARPVDRLTISGVLRRPVQAAMDRALTFVPAGDGLYRAQADSLIHGKWEVAIVADTSDAQSVFRAEKILWLQ